MTLDEPSAGASSDEPWYAAVADHGQPTQTWAVQNRVTGLGYRVFSRYDAEALARQLNELERRRTEKP